MKSGRIFAAVKRSALVLAAVVCLSATKASNAALLFDNISAYESGTAGAVETSTSSTPNTFMGDGYTLAAGATDITGFDIYPVNVSGTSYTGLKITIYVWGTVNTGTVSAAAPAFSNLLGSYTLTSAGTFTTGFFFPFEGTPNGVNAGITLGSPLVIPSSTVGLTFNYQGTTDGVTYASANSLTSLISTGVAPTVGSDVFNGYYRNAAGETNGNFSSTLRSLGLTNQSLAVRIYGDSTSVPEPVSIALLAPAGLLLVRRRRTQA